MAGESCAGRFRDDADAHDRFPQPRSSLSMVLPFPRCMSVIGGMICRAGSQETDSVPATNRWVSRCRYRLGTGSRSYVARVKQWRSSIRRCSVFSSSSVSASRVLNTPSPSSVGTHDQAGRDAHASFPRPPGDPRLLCGCNRGCGAGRDSRRPSRTVANTRSSGRGIRGLPTAFSRRTLPRYLTARKFPPPQHVPDRRNRPECGCPSSQPGKSLGT